MSKENLDMTSHAAIHGTCTELRPTDHTAQIALHDGTTCPLEAVTDIINEFGDPRGTD
jgi:hypothetical protein